MANAQWVRRGGEVEKAPELKRAPTRSEKAKEAVEGKRVTVVFTVVFG